MLTATYSIVTISTEQKNVRGILFRLQQAIENAWNSFKNVDLSSMVLTLEKLAHFDHYCHSRKVELYVIPAVRGVSREIDALIAELESLSLRGLQILKSLQQQVRLAVEKGTVELAALHVSMDHYCRNQMEMLAKEETELMPMVGRALTVDAWFSIATQLLSDDESAKVVKRP